MNINNTLKTALEQHQKGLFDSAEAGYRKVLKSDPGNLPALKFLGRIYAQSHRPTEAIACMKKAYAKDKLDVDLQLMYAPQLIKAEAFSEAETVLRTTVKRSPASDYAHYLLALAIAKTRRFAEAIEICTTTLALNAAQLEARYLRARTYAEIDHHQEAIDDYERIIEQGNVSADAYYRRGYSFFKLGRIAEAINDFLESLTLNPGSFEVNALLGESLLTLKLHRRAEEAFYRAMNADASRAYIMSKIVSCRHFSCNWKDFEPDNQYLTKMILSGESIESPFSFLNITASARDQLICNNLRVEYQFDLKQPKPQFSSSKKQKIRLGYVSADYYGHATTVLCERLFACHDRQDFEVIGISLLTNKNDPTTERLRQIFDAYHEVSNVSDEQAAEVIRALDIDILIDLKGHTQDSKPGIFARYPAPVQVNYLGFPGSMGGNLMDYIIADEYVIPRGYETFYSEKIVRLPGSYQINNNQREMASDNSRKEDHGLPQDGFVFCCFNNNYKITPDVFSIWMRLLSQVPGSVLWLLADNEEATENLKREAAQRGIDPDRIIFAARLGVAEHLARHKHADLFLDTLPINAHTTTSDALWAGLPVLTCTGEAFAARVASSLLHAAGVPELVTHNHADYEALALHLARDADSLKDLRHRLKETRNACDLFNTEKTTRNIEAAYRAMHARRQSGLAAEHIFVAADGQPVR